MQSGAGNEKSETILATPMTRPTIKDQKAPLSFILGQRMAMQKTIAMGGDK